MSWLPVLATLVCVFRTPASVGQEVRWRTGAVQMPHLDRTELAATLTGLASRPDARHLVVQFDRPVESRDRSRLARSGLTLLRSIGNHTFFATLSERTLDASALSATPPLTGAQGIKRRWKLDGRILDGQVPSWALVGETDSGNAVVGLYVLFHADVALLTEAAAAVQRHGATIRDELESINGLVIELPLSKVSALADEDVVQWLEWPLPQFSEVNDSNRSVTEVDLVQAAPYGLTGSGVTVLVYDGGTARATHVDFETRLFVYDSSGTSDHSTHVAGTIGGAGIANSIYKGMAPGVVLLSYGFEHDGAGIFLYNNPGDLESDYDQAINFYGADIANNSIGSNTEPNGFPCNIQGDYGVTAGLIDAIVSGSLGAPFRVIWANGNERQGSRCDVEGYGDYYSVAPPAGAKNPITIGALNSNDDSMTSFSSWGPVDDGRIRPDLSAPGCQSNGDGGVTSCSSAGNTAYTTKCGTSMAAPTVCGASALLLEDFRNQFPGEPDFRNSTLKALLAHNAEDIENVGPDYKTGYGSIRIQRTVDFMRTGNFLETQVDQDESRSILVLVGPGDDELKVTLAWDDFPGTPNVDFALVNDLDLRVVNASSQQYYPWTLDPDNPGATAVRVRPDHVNNLEQVVVDNPTPGIWQVRVQGFDIPQGPQTFSLCASPEIIACSAQGIIGLDASIYACTSTAEIQVVDCDLNTDHLTSETVTAVIASDSEPGAETVLLMETGADTADFRATIPLDVVDGPGTLWVADGDTITATYVDADNGQGGYDVTVNALASADCSGPVISNVQLANVGDHHATVTFQTLERSTGTVRYGLSCAALTQSASESRAGTSHIIEFAQLTDGQRYFFVIDAVDERGYASTDDADGLCYSFYTLDVVYSFPLDVDPGWTTEGQWAFGPPTGQGGQFGWPDPATGYTGPNVYGYNLSGDYSNNIPEHHLTTATLDCTDRTGVTVTFRRWLGVERPYYDHAYLRASNDGSNWLTVWENAHEVADDTWVRQTFDISNVADNKSSVYLRWTMGPTDGGWTYCGWNIDDLRILADANSAAPTCDDGIQNQDEERIDCGGPCPPCDCTSDSHCDDGLFCSGAESCDQFGHCQSGPGIDCDDTISCTTDSCNEGTDSCDHVPDHVLCSNGLYCDGVETCNALVGCQAGTAVNCSDGVACTDDSCNETSDSCDNLPNDNYCSNDQFCDGVETCDPVLGCRSGTAVDCHDGVSCTQDSCNEATDSCDHIPDDALCDNGVFCDGLETCDPLFDCQSGSAVNCSDSIACTDDFCNEAAGSCEYVPNDGNCNNGQFCDGIEVCDPVQDCVVQEGSVPDCSDGVDCTTDWCDEDGDVCINVPDHAYCDNHDYCDGIEICDLTQGCITSPGSIPNCDDGIDCTIDSCNEVDDVCVNLPDDQYCDNGLFCDGAEFCDPPVGCRDGGVPCPPGTLCRESDDQCVDCLVDLDCDDQDPCTGTDSCQPDGTCLSVVATDCNDNNIEDFCDIDHGTSQDCNENLIPDECDLAGGTSPDDNDTGVPDECEVSAPTAAAPPDDGRKNRYLSFSPGNVDLKVAFQVEMTASVLFPDSTGGLGWVAQPDTDGISRVNNEPVFRVWSEPVVHAGDCEVVPVATYEIRATVDGVILSSPFEVATIHLPEPKWWADCVGAFDGATWSRPDGVVNMDDVMAAVQKFEQVAGAPPLTWVDVHDEVPDKTINFTDIFRIILGFKGEVYPFRDPASCP